MVAPATNPSAARCQCDPKCKNPPLDDSPFCANHTTSNRVCPRISPTTGAEPPYDPDLYNKQTGQKNAQNCFAYAFHHRKLPKGCTNNSCSVSFPQPGLKSGYLPWSKVDGKRCPDLMARLLGDVPGLIPSTFEAKCPTGSSKIAFVVDEDEDYHFYRQDSNGNWSHKPGATEVTNKDATGRLIYDPELASRKYSKTGLNYDGFCGYLCVPRNKVFNFTRGGKSKKYNKRRRQKTIKQRNTRKTKKLRK